MRSCLRAVIVAMLVLCTAGVAGSSTSAQGNVQGTVYTSPTFGYQLQWSAPWFFVEETSEDGFDSLLLYDGISEANFLLAFAPGITLQEILDMSGSMTMPGVTNFQPMLDALGSPIAGTIGDQEWALYSGTQTLDDGTAIEFMQYFNLRSLAGGVMLFMSGVTVSYFWDDTSLQGWHDFAATVLVNPVPTPEPTAIAPCCAPTPDDPSGQRPGPDISPTAAPDVSPTVAADVTPSPEPASPPAGVGEPAPAFAAGPWRVAVRAVDLGESIDYLGLGFVDGNQWVVVYADITNWSETDAQLDAASMTMVTAGGPVAPDAISTQSAATLLGLEPANGSSVLVPAGGSTRVALVYSIPVSESALILLSAGGNQLPLEDAVGRQFDVTDLSTIATPPAVQQGTVGTIPLDGAVQFFVGDTLVKLAGVGLPSDAGCTDGNGPLLLALGDLYGTTVWLEADPTVTEPDTYYVWYEDEQGNRVLLNQTLLADGLAIEGDLPEDARFGAWLEHSEDVARSTGSGIWETCG